MCILLSTCVLQLEHIDMDQVVLIPVIRLRFYTMDELSSLVNYISMVEIPETKLDYLAGVKIGRLRIGQI